MTDSVKTWKGCSLKDIFWGESMWKLPHTPEIRSSDSHAVLYNMPIDEARTSPPKPRKDHTKWDTEHVRLPSSHLSQYPVINEMGEARIEIRWELIQNALLKPIFTSNDLEKAILEYNSKYENIWKFRTLHKLFQEELQAEESFAFFETILPRMIRLALQLPDLIPNAIPLLKMGDNRSVSMTQQQVACLLANAFLCTFPRRNTRKKNSEYSTFPDINFNRLFEAEGQRVMEKLKCVCNYFRRVCEKMPVGVITFSRRSYAEEQFPNWDQCDTKFSAVQIHVAAEGTIEDNGLGMLQVDFANKFIGGGVLRSGSVQEEIRFVINPELLITRLFVEVIKPNEAVFIYGSEQFNTYDGYASSFEWHGNFVDDTPSDSSGRRKTSIVAIDALRFIHPHHQYRDYLMERELHKAYVGFKSFSNKSPATPVATGNWGCGAFKGSPHLKSALQLMVCAVISRPLVYFTFGDAELRDSIYGFYQFLCDQNVTVSELWKYLRRFGESRLPPEKLFQFVFDQNLNAPAFASSFKTTLPATNKKSPRRTETRKQELDISISTPKIKPKLDSSLSTPQTSTSASSKPPHRLFKVQTDTAVIHSNPARVQAPPSPPPNKLSLLDCLDEVYDRKETSKKPASLPQDVIINISMLEAHAADEPMETADDVDSAIDDDDTIIPATPECSIEHRKYRPRGNSDQTNDLRASPVASNAVDVDVIPPTPGQKINKSRQKNLLDFFAKKS